MQFLLEICYFSKTFNEISDFHVRPLMKTGFAPTSFVRFTFFNEFFHKMWTSCNLKHPYTLVEFLSAGLNQKTAAEVRSP